MKRPLAANAASELWHNSDFMKLWIGQTISEFGSRITRDGLPLVAILVLAATPAQMGILLALSSLPVLVLGLFAGVWVDRLRRRPIMIACDLLRLALLLSVPIAALTGCLIIEWVYIVAASMAILGLIFEIAYRAFLPSLISRDQLLDGNSKLATTDALAEIGGPAITGFLIQLVSAPIALLFDSISYVFSALSFGLIRKRELPPPKRESSESAVSQIRIELVEGMRQIVADPILRTLAIGMALRNFFGYFIGVLYDLHAVRELGLSPALLGVVVACGGIGALIGSALAGWLPRRASLGNIMIGALLCAGMVNLLIPLAGGSPQLAALVLVIGQIIGDAAMMVFFINETSLRQMIVPNRLQGRVGASFGFLAQGIAPIGALAAGGLATVLGSRMTLWIAVIGILMAAIWMTFSPIKRLEGISLTGEINDNPEPELL